MLRHLKLEQGSWFLIGTRPSAVVVRDMEEFEPSQLNPTWICINFEERCRNRLHTLVQLYGRMWFICFWALFDTKRSHRVTGCILESPAGPRLQEQSVGHLRGGWACFGVSVCMELMINVTFKEITPAERLSAPEHTSSLGANQCYQFHNSVL